MTGAGKPKVVCLASRLTTGGATLNAQMLADRFRALGCDAELWCLYASGTLQASEAPVRVFLDRPPRSPLALARMVARFFGAVAAWRPDAMFGFHPLANILGAVSMRRHGAFIGTQRNPSDSQSFVTKRLERWIGGTALYAGNIAVSEAVAASYAHYPARYRRKLAVIHNGLPPLAPTAEDKAGCRRALGLPEDAFLVGNVGRLHHQKNPEFLIDVVAAMPEVTLLLAGDGPDEHALRQRAAALGDRVIFLGRVEGVDITRSYRALDLFLFPSRFEGFGRSLIEAMSEGLPVIANDLPVTREVAGDCAQFAPTEIERWRVAINKLFRGETAVDPARARARAALFDAGAMARAYLALAERS